LYTETRHRLKVFQNRMLKGVFGREGVEEDKKSVNKGELPARILHIALQVSSNKGG
jgi:hypothetical protein